MIPLLLILITSLQDSPTPPATKMTLPILVTVEGGGKVPGAAKGRSPRIQLVPVAGGKALETPLGSKDIAVGVKPGVTEEYRVRVEDLPDGYVVKSMTFKSEDVSSDTIKASVASLGAFAAMPRIVTFSGEGELQAIVDRVMRPPEGLVITLALKP